ncbi:hypothetical protein D3C87_1780590 [compost metagenome]
MVVVQRVLEAAVLGLRQRMRGVDHCRELVGAVGPGLEAFQVGRVPADAQRCRALAQRLHHVTAQAFLDGHAHIAVGRLLQEGGNIVRQRFCH